MLFGMLNKVNRIPIGLTAYATLAGIALVSMSALTACFMHADKGVKPCRYRFQDLLFTGIDASASHWKLTIAVANPNPKPVTLTRLRYALVHETDTLLSGANPEEKLVAAGDSLVAVTSLDIPNALWQRLPAGIWSQTDAAFTIVGDAYVHTWMGDFMVPQAIKQTVHVDMTKQVARMKEMLMKQLFGGGWPGKHLQEGGIVGPDTTTPGPARRPGNGGGDDPL